MTEYKLKSVEYESSTSASSGKYDTSSQTNLYRIHIQATKTFDLSKTSSQRNLDALGYHGKLSEYTFYDPAQPLAYTCLDHFAYIAYLRVERIA